MFYNAGWLPSKRPTASVPIKILPALRAKAATMSKLIYGFTFRGRLCCVDAAKSAACSRRRKKANPFWASQLPGLLTLINTYRAAQTGVY